MLHLPDMAELVGDEVAVAEEGVRAEQDRPVDGIAVEAAEPRQPEEPGNDPDPDAAERDRTRVELETVEPLLCAVERSTLRRAPRADAIASPVVKRRILRLLDRAGLIGPAFRTYERVVSLRPGRPTSVEGPPLPPRRLMVRVAGTADAEWFLRSGRAAYDAIAAHVPLDSLESVLDFGCGCGRVTRYWSDFDGSRQRQRREHEGDRLVPRQPRFRELRAERARRRRSTSTPRASTSSTRCRCSRI